MRRLIALGLVAAGLAAAAPAAAVAQQPRARFDTDVFALIPKPGFPAHAYVAPNGRVYEGTYTNPTGDTMNSRVFEYRGDGTLLRSWVVTDQDLSGDHGVQVATMDARGRLILLDKSPPRVVRLDRTTGRQTTIARFPAGAVPNYAAWAPGGALYVTDYEGGKIWRMPKGGGTPEVWLEGPQLEGGPFGTTGIVLAKDRKTFYIAQQSAAGLGAGNPATGRIYTVEIQPDGTPGPIRQFWESGLLDGPDGFAIAQSGTIYMTALLTNQLIVIGPDGTTRERFPATPLSGANGSPVPFDAPSSARFLGTRLLIANQSFLTGTAANQAILDVEVGEAGQPEFIPKAAKKKPAKAKPKPKSKKKTKKRKKRRR